jgi:hypothetical protein
MLNFLRRWLDEMLTGSFLFLVLVLTLLGRTQFATAGGRTLAQWVLSAAGALVVGVLVAVRLTPRARPALRAVIEIGPMLVAVLGYVSLRLFDATVITRGLGISRKDPWMLAADVALFGKTPYVWFSQWGLDSRLFLQVMSVFYGLYPLTPLLVLSWLLYRGDMTQFRLVRRTVLISLYCGYCCYILLPVAGPLSLTTPTSPIFVESTATYSFLMDNFRFSTDCFPSLHTANPWLLVWLCRKKWPVWMTALAMLICTGITMSTLALRFHYGIDDVAGLVWIFPIWLVARATLPRTEDGGAGLERGCRC